MEEKLAIASYNNPNELIKGRKFETFVDIRKDGYLTDKLQFTFILCIYHIVTLHK